MSKTLAKVYSCRNYTFCSFAFTLGLLAKSPKLKQKNRNRPPLESFKSDWKEKDVNRLNKYTDGVSLAFKVLKDNKKIPRGPSS